MNAALKGLGMVRAFANAAESGGAEFDGICAPSAPNQRLFLAKVLHKTFVEVNEKGTEAAAATAVEGGLGGMPVMVPFVPTFRADKPFVFLIRDKPTGSILFLGRMAHPGPAE